LLEFGEFPPAPALKTISYLLRCSDLRLLGSPDLLHPVLLLLLLLGRGLGSLLDDALPHQPVLRLKLFGVVHGVVDEGKAGGLAAAKVSLGRDSQIVKHYS
jgi:hypothetical protein